MSKGSGLSTLLALSVSALLLAGATPPAGANPARDRPRLDANGDGQVDLAEMQAARPEFTVEQFNKADANGDGLLTREELHRARGQSRFARLDQDGDGSVSLAELQSMRPELTAEKYAQMDADGNGQLSPEELRAAVRDRAQRQRERQDRQP